ncbi:hypothetical protein [Shinella sp.]|uniref:hypothetical protein n=1 Tax=Shinella sp. TaxID=1870904 RepID=UPI002584E2A3|nr:hypothetical protein [Shinella sp.]MCW5711547.1 hypothetical protein [Shinella sp.]
MKSRIADLAMDIDCLHDEEVDAQRFNDRDDPFSPAAEEVLLDAWNLVSPVGEALEEAISALEAILPGWDRVTVDVEDITATAFPEPA